MNLEMIELCTGESCPLYDECNPREGGYVRRSVAHLCDCGGISKCKVSQ